ncbi:MAG: biotin holocarboxylase synthetase [Caeruleum heppii]|nr:MAG: biotin holocarboxylase synthetase [Caeruleum heppii]
MATSKMNVLVYSGNGSTIESVRHCLYSLRRLLSPNYAVIPVTGDIIIKEPWSSSCALLVFPGGADLGYCRTLNGEGNRRITEYVQRGGSYLGLCAGGYYGSKRVEFEVGNRKLEVVGNRELAFFPGTCRGSAFPGFVYHSEDGAKAVELKVNNAVLSGGTVPSIFRSYFNGGGVFVDAEEYKDRGVDVLATFNQSIAVDGGKGAAAAVHCKVGEGRAILTGPHPEFAAVNLDPKADGPDFPKIINAIAADDQQRTDFLKAILIKLGLTVSQETNAVPSLSRLHLSSFQSSEVTSLLSSLKDVITNEHGGEYIRGANDVFHLHRSSVSSWPSLTSLVSALPGVKSEEDVETDEEPPAEGDRLALDYDKIIKQVQTHETEWPGCKETPYFNHHAYYGNLRHYQAASKVDGRFGRNLLYGEVVTSTNTMLEKNHSLLEKLPTGFTSTATVQIAGRGRGSNVWVSPAGSLMFSTVIRHPIEVSQKAPIIFVQYLVALAIVEGVRNYDAGYGPVGAKVRLKWPNDIYAEDPNGPRNGERRYVKIGGILVNSSTSGGESLLVVGCGLNTTNPSPTTSLNALLPSHLPAFTLEKLLARILTSFEALYEHFCARGWSLDLERKYHEYWLHTDQIITLTTTSPPTRCRILGLTRDYGLLRAAELGWEDRATGKMWELQSDANSFDFLRGLVGRKVS